MDRDSLPSSERPNPVTGPIAETEEPPIGAGEVTGRTPIGGIASWRLLLHFAVIVILTATYYAPFFRLPWDYIDDSRIANVQRRDAQIPLPRRLAGIIGQDYSRHRFKPLAVVLYHGRAILGSSPLTARCVQYAIFLLNVSLAFFLVARITGRVWPAYLCIFLFACVPSSVDFQGHNANWVRLATSEPLLSLFFLTGNHGLLCLLRQGTGRWKRFPGFLVWVVGTTAAYMTKETAVILPLFPLTLFLASLAVRDLSHHARKWLGVNAGLNVLLGVFLVLVLLRMLSSEATVSAGGVFLQRTNLESMTEAHGVASAAVLRGYGVLAILALAGVILGGVFRIAAKSRMVWEEAWGLAFCMLAVPSYLVLLIGPTDRYLLPFSLCLAMMIALGVSRLKDLFTGNRMPIRQDFRWARLPLHIGYLTLTACLLLIPWRQIAGQGKWGPIIEDHRAGIGVVCAVLCGTVLLLEFRTWRTERKVSNTGLGLTLVACIAFLLPVLSTGLPGAWAFRSYFVGWIRTNRNLVDVAGANAEKTFIVATPLTGDTQLALSFFPAFYHGERRRPHVTELKRMVGHQPVPVKAGTFVVVRQGRSSDPALNLFLRDLEQDRWFRRYPECVRDIVLPAVISNLDLTRLVWGNAGIHWRQVWRSSRTLRTGHLVREALEEMSLERLPNGLWRIIPNSGGYWEPFFPIRVRSGIPPRRQASFELGGVEISRPWRGLQLYVIDSGDVYPQVFDTCQSEAESDRFAKAVEALPEGTLAALAIRGEGTRNLNEPGARALRSLGSQLDLRGRTRAAYAAVCLKRATGSVCVEQLRAGDEEVAEVLIEKPSFLGLE